MPIENIIQKIRKILIKIPLMESFYSFFLRFLITPYSRRKLKFGKCILCKKKTLFLIDTSELVNTGLCLFCSANTRNRWIAENIKKIIIIKLLKTNLNYQKLQGLINKINLANYSLKNAKDLINSTNFMIYEPSSIGAIYKVFKKYKNFVFSEYFSYPNLKKGQYFGNTRFEDLQDLSFNENYFDLIITQDVLEHIENPDLAFKEIYRVLKPNGIHIFTTPIGSNKKSINYFDSHGNLLRNKIVYHKDPLRSEGIKVYTQFGLDIIDTLKSYNFSSFILYPKINYNNGIFSRRIDLIISIKN